MRHAYKILCGLLALNLGLFACESSNDKGIESELPIDGTADSWRSPTLHGELIFAQSNPASFEDDALYHAWDFSLEGRAELLLQVEQENLSFDTVMYLYQRDEDTLDWGSYMARNDDANDQLLSRLHLYLSAGNYRVMVKGYSKTLRGDFALRADHVGGGCQPVLECVFGEDINDLDQRSTFDFGAWGVVDETNIGDLSPIRAAQIVSGASAMEGQAMGLTEAVTYNDDAEIRVQDFSAAFGPDYSIYTYYLGDTMVGFIFADGDQIQAAVEDSDLYDCRPEDDAGACLFGEMLWQMEESETLSLSNEVILTAANLDTLSTTRRAQLEIGLAGHENQVVSFPEYWEQVDEGKIWMRDVLAADGRRFVLFDFGQGDNSFGFVFNEAELILAMIGDGEIDDCQAMMPSP